MMTPIMANFPAGVAGDGGEAVKSSPGAAAESFAQFFMEKLADNDRSSLFGVAAGNRSGAVSLPKSLVDPPRAGGETLVERQSLVERLIDFLEQLSAVAEDPGVQAGEWQLPAADESCESLVQSLFAAAGFDEAPALAAIKEDGDDRVDLSALLNLLIQHFEKAKGEVEVRVPETDLPVLENILSKMGVGPDELWHLAEQAVPGDYWLDLAEYAEQLAALPPPEQLNPDGELPQITLSPRELEQLAAVFARAGLTGEQSEQLLNEVVGSGNKLDIEQFGELITSAVNRAEDNLLRLDLPKFLGGLGELLTRAGFTDKGVGFSPVVQETLEQVYRDLVSTAGAAPKRSGGIELNQVRESAGKDLPLDEEIDPGSLFVEEPTAVPPIIRGAGRFMVKPLYHYVLEVSDSLEQPKDSGMVSGPSPSMVPVLNRDNQLLVSAAAPVRAASPEVLKQPLFDQISRGVLSGLGKRDHHLIIKLFPADLGEVKVDLMVRNNHVAASFVMENHQVKEAFEAGMGQFRDNLADQGFNLGECMVSVGQDNNGGEAWQRFEEAWHRQVSSGGGVMSAGSTGDNSYEPPTRFRAGSGSVNLVV